MNRAYHHILSDFKGMSISVLEKINRRTGVQYELVLADVNTNKTEGLKYDWSRLFRKIWLNEADMIPIPLVSTAERDKMATLMSGNVLLDELVLLVVYRQRDMIYFLTQILDGWFYLKFPLTFILSIIVIHFCKVMSPYGEIGRVLHHYPEELNQSSMKYLWLRGKWTETAWYVAVGMFQRSPGPDPLCFSARVASAGWHLLCLLLLTSFSAKMINLQTMDRSINDQLSMEDLEKRVNTGVLKIYASNEQDSMDKMLDTLGSTAVYKTLQDKMKWMEKTNLEIAEQFLLNTNEEESWSFSDIFTNEVKLKRNALLTYLYTSQNVLSKLPNCYSIKTFRFYTPIKRYFAFSEHFKFKDEFDEGLQELASTGEIDHDIR